MIATVDPRRLLRVFLCHSSQDKPVVRDLYGQLLADGIEPWFDEEDLLPGQDWHLEITKAIRTSDIVLVCISQNSTSKVGYIQKEIRYILDLADEQPEGTMFVIPLKLDQCEVPERLRKWQWVSRADPRWYERLMGALQQRAQFLNLAVKTESKVGKNGAQGEQFSRLHEVIDRIEGLLRPVINKKRLDFLSVVPQDTVVSVPFNTTFQVLMTLAVNAIDASPVESTIRIECQDDGTAISCHVIDGGPGVPIHSESTIFNLGSSTKPGSGFGLYLARRLMTAQGGEVLLTSSGPRGARFTVRFRKK